MSAKPTLDTAFGYQDDAMNLPVADVEAAIPFYEKTLGFHVVSRVETPNKSAILARDRVQIRLAENGGDPTQDGVAFQVTNLRALFDEFRANGLQKELGEFDREDHGGSSFQVFYVVAPDGLCYWFGEREATAAS